MSAAPGFAASVAALLSIVGLACGPAYCQTPVGLRQAALSSDGRQLAFTYQGDIWRCHMPGGKAERVSAHAAHDGHPAWSPDANRIAFSSRRSGGYDVYVIAAGGGEPLRLTFHPADDIVCDWSPDGRAVLFSSDRHGAVPDLYEVEVTTGRVRRVTHDPRGARDGKYAPDGRAFYYTSGLQRWWETGYRGPACGVVSRMRLDGVGPERLTDAQGYDGLPAVGRLGVFIASVRQGKYSVRRLPDVSGTTPSTVSESSDPITGLACSRAGDRLVMERGGELWQIDAERRGSPVRVEIAIGTDLRTMPRQTVRRTRGFTDLAISPDGKRIAFASGGDIWMSTLEPGDAVRLTTTPGPERHPSWAPDGKKLMYVAVRDDRTDLYMLDTESKEETRLTEDDGEEARPRFAPEGTRIAYVRTDRGADGLVVRHMNAPADEPLGPATLAVSAADIQDFDWSPDGRWLAYSSATKAGGRDIYVMPAAGGGSVNITRASGDLRSPRWSRDGRFIACVGSMFDRAGLPQSGVVVIPLTPELTSAGAPAGAAPQSDDQPERSGDEPVAQRRRPPNAGPSAGEQPPGMPSGPPWPFGPPMQPNPRVSVALDGIAERVRLAVPVSGRVDSVAVAPDSRTLVFCDVGDSNAWLVAADSQSRAAMRLADASGGAGPVAVLPDSSGLVWLAGDGSIRHLRRGTPVPTSPTIVCTSAMDRREVALEAFRETWRALRSAERPSDWPEQTMRAARSRLEPVAASAETSEDFGAAVLALFGSAGTWTADALIPGPSDSVGHLGLDYDADYAGPGVRISGVVPGGPSTAVPQSPVAGEYLHSVDGKPCTSPEQVWDALRGLAGKELGIVVGVKPPTGNDGPAPGVRTLRVRAVTREDEATLRWNAEAANAAARVAELTSGTVRYTRLRGLEDDAIRRAVRDLSDEHGRARAWIVDLRDLDSSDDHKAALRALADPVQGAVARHPVPRLPLVVLVNERTRYGAEALAHALRAMGRAEVVGAPTAGLGCSKQQIVLATGVSLRLLSHVYRSADDTPLLGRSLIPDYRAGDDRERQLSVAVERALALTAGSS